MADSKTERERKLAEAQAKKKARETKLHPCEPEMTAEEKMDEQMHTARRRGIRPSRKL